jgi:hypothetical protein
MSWSFFGCGTCEAGAFLELYHHERRLDMNCSETRKSTLGATAMMSLVCVAFLTLEASILEAQTLPDGVTELARFSNLDAGNRVAGMTVNRNGVMASVHHTIRTDDLDVVVTHNAPAGIHQSFIPDASRTIGFTFSNWGIAARLDQNGGPPARVVAGPVDGLIEEVTVGVSGEPFVNDTGAIVYRAQGALYLSQRGEMPEQLPSLGGVGVTEFPVIDGSGRIIARHSFQASPTSETSDIYRYDAEKGWVNLTATLDPGEYPWELADSRFPHINATGDYLFQSTVADSAGKRHYLNRFESSTNAIERLADLTIVLPNGETTARQVQAGIADSGSILLLLGSDEPDEWNLIFRRTDQSIVRLNDFLPAHEFVPADQSLTQNFLTNGGKVLFHSQNSLTGDYSYHVYDERVEGIYTIPELAMLPHLFTFPTLSDKGEVYIWLDAQPEAVLGVVRVPEPPSMVAALISVGAAIAVLRIARPNKRCLPPFSRDLAVG